MSFHSFFFQQDLDQLLSKLYLNCPLSVKKTSPSIKDDRYSKIIIVPWNTIFLTSPFQPSLIILNSEETSGAGLNHCIISQYILDPPFGLKHTKIAKSVARNKFYLSSLAKFSIKFKMGSEGIMIRKNELGKIYRLIASA